MARKKMKGKKWYVILAPEMFGKKVIGETAATYPDKVIGRTIKLMLNELMGRGSKYYFKIKLKVYKFENNSALTEYIGHECTRDFVSRMIRRRAARVDTRDVAITKDGKKIVVKIISVTSKKVTSSVKGSLRKKISETTKNLVSEMNLDKFVEDILSGKIQKKIKTQADKIYPLRQLEIRKTEVLE